MPSSEVPVLHTRHCRCCERPFAICCGCDRGHRYGSPSCSETSRRQLRRESKRRQLQTPHGRENNARHQREYRARRRSGGAFVRVPSSREVQGSATLTAEPLPTCLPQVASERPWEVACEQRAPTVSRCVVCSGTSEWTDPEGAGEVSHARCRSRVRDSSPA